MLKQKEIARFIAAYEQRFGVEISKEEATEMLLKIVLMLQQLH